MWEDIRGQLTRCEKRRLPCYNIAMSEGVAWEGCIEGGENGVRAGGGPAVIEIDTTAARCTPNTSSLFVASQLSAALLT